ncbi:sulfatase [Crateriforma conspicua]|uniref:sulfatase n=1 Tax=Crateriforma conspicua TaxID=2527996 RepID=UPI00119D20B6|nr:sulfatase [Crateriforma conspicua]
MLVSEGKPTSATSIEAQPGTQNSPSGTKMKSTRPTTLLRSSFCLPPSAFATFLLLSSFCLHPSAFAAPSAFAQNVLWVMADDLRPQLGCYGDEVVISPHIDQFAQRALRFDHAYVQSAVCSPSRNSMLSGLRPNTTGLRGFGTKVRDVIPDIVTLPQHFKNHGYETRAFGKIFHIYDESMLGDEDDAQSWSEPTRWPEVPVWGPEQNALRDRLIAGAKKTGKEFKHPHDWPRAETWDDSDIPDDQMQDGDTTAAVEKYLDSRQGDQTPFFLAVGFLRPHLPFNAPQKYWDLYDPTTLRLPAFRQLPRNVPAWVVNRGIVKNYHNMPSLEETDSAFLQRYLQAYLACISYVDACFGRLMEALEKSGHAENTIVVFMGDHGYQMGEYDSWGHKHSNFEISTRAPLLISSPRMARAGASSNALVEFLDLYPTLCDLAHLPKPEHLEGISFSDLLNDDTSVRDAACSEMKRQGRLGRSIRTAEFRYTEWRDPKNNIVARELYDHRNDTTPGQLEMENIISDPKMTHVVSHLSQRLNQLVPAKTEKLHE